MSETKTQTIETGMTLYEINQQVMAQLPPLDEQTLKTTWNIIGDWFGKDQCRWFMLMCKERSDFTLIHINDNKFLETIQELQEILEERGQILNIQYIHGEDVFEIWIKNDTGVYMFMLFGADWMVIEV